MMFRGGFSSVSNTSVKTVGRSFRINERWLNALNQEAERAGVSPNALLNKILKEYSQYDRFLSRFESIRLTAKSFSCIIQACPRDALVEIARKAGSDVAIDLFRTMRLKMDFENVTFFIETVLADYANWFICERYTLKDKDIFHLRHDLGENWSIYTAEVVSTIVERCCGRKVKKDYLEGAVTLEAQNRPGH